MTALGQKTTRRQFLCATGAMTAAALMPGVVEAQRFTSGSRSQVAASEMAESRLPGLTSIVKTFMEKNRVPEGTLAVGRNGRLEYTASFRRVPISEVGRIRPDSLFRLASVSKMFTAAAIQSLYDSGKLKPTTRVFPRLGITHKLIASQKVDPRINDITVQNLIDHAGGWIDHGDVKKNGKIIIHGTTFDPTYANRQISQALGLNHPVTSMDIALYMYGEPLQFTPGKYNINDFKQATYSNFGYMLLGMLVEQVTNMSFLLYLQKTLLDPLNIHDVYVAVTARSGRRPNEAVYFHPGQGLTVLNPASNAKLPIPYGGEFETEITVGAGGLLTSAPTLVRFAAHHAAFGMGGRAAGSARSGGFAGTATWVESRGDGRDWAYLFDTDIFPAKPPWDLATLPKTIDKYLDNHR